ncbi:hypothetical protein J14TS5_05760 [Paenibacillus lautus]|nr:hypothetical protein J14TS5_05760 [Paenibacillus lautus]
MLPEPKLSWEIASWIASCCSSVYFSLEEFAFASLEEIEREIPAEWTHVRGMLKKIAGL